tara:strand:- start:43 stop:282 length:240 start_codon:yes stop_codon:yes gene_type:complete
MEKLKEISQAFIKELLKAITITMVAITFMLPVSVVVCGSQDICTSNTIERYENDRYNDRDLMHELTKKLDSLVIAFVSK